MRTQRHLQVQGSTVYRCEWETMRETLIDLQLFERTQEGANNEYDA